MVRLAGEVGGQTGPAVAELAGGPDGNTMPPQRLRDRLTGADWEAMFHNSARNLEERRTDLFNAVLERAG